MHLKPDGAGYCAAFTARRDAGELPDFATLYPLLRVTEDSVSIDDVALERAIDGLGKIAGNRWDVVATCTLVLRGARDQRDAWLVELTRWWVAYARSPRSIIDRLQTERLMLGEQLGRSAWLDGLTHKRIDAINDKLSRLPTPATGGPNTDGKTNQNA